MIFPERPTASPWQLLGQALTQGAGVVDTYGNALDDEDKKKNVLQDLVARRTAAALEQQRQAREDARKEMEFAQGQEDYKRKKDEADRFDKANSELRKYGEGDKKETKAAGSTPYLAPGLGPNNETSMATPAEYETAKPSRDEMQRKAFELGVYGDPGNKAYFEDTKPAALSLEDRIALIQKTADVKPPEPATPYVKVDTVDPATGLPKTVFVDPRNPGGKVVDPGLPKPVAPKTNPKDKLTAKVKLQSLTLAKTQLKNIQDRFNAIKNSVSAGPGGQGLLPTPSGKAFDASVDALRQTISGLTRVPGVGAQSDYETKLTQAANPSRSDYESVTQQKIDQLNQLVNILDSGYSGMVSQDDAGASPASSPTDNKRGTLLRKKYNY